jgi:16S rRNA processing protein RimM
MSSDHLIPVGYVRRAHGIRGDVLVRGLGADAEERFVVGVPVTTGEDDPRSFDIVSLRPQRTDYLIHLAGVDTRNDAEALVGVQFVIEKADRRDLDEDEWWIEDVVGCHVFDIAGERIGEVTGVVVGSSQDRLVVDTDDGRRGEIPLVDPLVPTVDIELRRVVVDLPEGLIEG